MIFRIILTISLLGVGLYAVALRRRIAVLGNIAAVAAIAALLLVWKPEYANAIANRVGIGRGADLIFYCWVIISLTMILNLHFRIRSHNEQMTELIRRLTLARPMLPKQDVSSNKPESADAPH